jgi:hypothetical protein
MGSIHEKNQRSTISCYCTFKAARLFRLFTSDTRQTRLDSKAVLIFVCILLLDYSVLFVQVSVFHWRFRGAQNRFLYTHLPIVGIYLRCKQRWAKLL